MFGVKEAAKRLGLSPVTVKKRARGHDIGIKIDSTFAFTDEDIDKLREVAPKNGRPFTGKALDIDTIILKVKQNSQSLAWLSDLVDNCTDCFDSICPPECKHFLLCSKFNRGLGKKMPE